MDKMPCLRAYAPSGIRTPYLLIASREHEPLHHSAPIHHQCSHIYMCHTYGINCRYRDFPLTHSRLGLWLGSMRNMCYSKIKLSLGALADRLTGDSLGHAACQAFVHGLLCHTTSRAINPEKYSHNLGHFRKLSWPYFSILIKLLNNEIAKNSELHV